MLQDMAILTGGQVITEEVGLKLENATLDLLGRAKQGHRHQGRDHDRRGRRRRGRHQGPHQPDQGRDREHRLRLRPREAAGAPRQAVRRRRRAQGRRRHRGRAQGEEAPHRGRRVAPPRPPSRRASCPAVAWPCCVRRPRCSTVADDARAATRPPAPASWPSRSRRRSSRSPRTPASRAASWSSRVRRPRRAPRASTPPPASTRTSSRLGVIDAAKVTRSALQNAASIAALFLTTEAVIADKPEKDCRRRHARRRHGGLLSKSEGSRGGCSHSPDFFIFRAMMMR